MANNNKLQFVTVSFLNFDPISKKLILTRLNDPKYAIELTHDPLQADLVFFNQEQAGESKDIENWITQLLDVDTPLLLLTEFQHAAETQLFKVVKKPYKNRQLSQYLYRLKDVFYQELDAKLARKKAQNSTKLIYNKHLSNALNPAQIRFESNRYYAQKYVGLNPDIDFDDKEALPKILIDPKSYLFHYLKSAFQYSLKKRKISCLKTVYGVFYIDAADKLIYHDKSATEIINIHKIPFYQNSKITVPKLKRGQLDQLHQFDYEPFVWLSSINASKGKIPHDINFNATVKLKAWPDLTKLIVFKHAIRIISLWSRGVYSLKHTARLLDIPQRYPLTVYTAMHALGLITEVKKR